MLETITYLTFSISLFFPPPDIHSDANNQAEPAVKKLKVEDGVDAADFSMAGLAKGKVTEVSVWSFIFVLPNWTF